MPVKTINVKISKESIEKGIRKHCEFCPIALELKNMGYEDVFVGGKFIDIKDEGKYRRFTLDEKAVDFITKFDCGSKVEECEITASYVYYEPKKEKEKG